MLIAGSLKIVHQKTRNAIPFPGTNSSVMSMLPLEDTITMSSNIGHLPQTELIQDKRKFFLVFCFFILFIIAVSLPFCH